jgi:hypothetical protein
LEVPLLAEAGREREALDAVLEALDQPQQHRRAELMGLGEALARALGDEAAADLRVQGGPE